MRILLLFTILFISTSSFGQSLLGSGKISSAQPVKITAVSFSDFGESVVAGTYFDSVNVAIDGSTYMLYGGSSATGIYNSFVVTYDNYGYIISAMSLGTVTDSVKVNGAHFGNGGVVTTGSFVGTVDFSGGISSPQTLTATGVDAFVCYYTPSLIINSAALIETTGSRAVGTSVFLNGFNEILVVGYYDGTIDLDPSAGNLDFPSTGTLNGFLAHYSGTTYMDGGSFEGSGKVIPTKIVADVNASNNVAVTGTYTNDLDVDLSAGTITLTGNSGNDAFVVYYNYNMSHVWNTNLAGTGNNIAKDVYLDNLGRAIVLVDYENSIDMDPNSSPYILTSNGLSDVALAAYDTSGIKLFAKSFGNANNNEGFNVRNVAAFGGRGIYDDLTFTMSFSGSMDFNPDPVNTAIEASQNTAINTAIIDVDSIGNYIMHGRVEGYSIEGFSVNDYNDVALFGNFSGTNVDILPYDSIQYQNHAVDAGFYTLYNRCHINMSTPEIFGPYECGSCSASLHVPSISNYRSPISYDWYQNEFYYTFDPIAMQVCPSDVDIMTLNIYDGWGCNAWDTLWILPHAQGVELDAILNITSTSCGTNFGSADATPVNALGTVSYYWSNGSTANSIDSLNAGVYTVQVTDDSLKCYVEKPVLIDNSNGPTITLVSSTNANCGNTNDGMIDISVSGGASPYTFLWSNGETTEDIASLAGGNYSVTVTDNAGCENNYCVDLTQGEPIYAYEENIYGTDCNFNNGAIMLYSNGGSGSHTYQWDANAGSSTNDTITNLYAGAYSVVVTDSLGCNETFHFGVNDFQGPYLYINYVDQPNCTGTTGFIDAYSFSSVGTGSMTYEWTSGEITEDISGVTPGEYVLVATDENGCKGTTKAWINDQLPFSPTVCMVTTDSTATQNVVVFDKSFSPEAEYYNIYREGYCNVNTFGVVGKVPQDSLSVFYDTVVNSDTRTWRYYVTAVDTCGNESDPSEIHRTIHLTLDWDLDTNLFLDWSDYVGMDVTKYKIFRKQPVGTLFDLIDSVDVSQTNYLDTINFSGYSEVEYFIDAVPLNSCTATRAYNQNEARSNHAKRNVPEAASTVSIIENTKTKITMFPNPANDLVQLLIENKDNWNLQILDHIGQVVINGTVNNRGAFTTKELPSGIYFVRVSNKNTNEIQVMKLVITH